MIPSTGRSGLALSMVCVPAQGNALAKSKPATLAKNAQIQYGRGKIRFSMDPLMTGIKCTICAFMPEVLVQNEPVGVMGEFSPES